MSRDQILARVSDVLLRSGISDAQLLVANLERLTAPTRDINQCHAAIPNARGIIPQKMKRRIQCHNPCVKGKVLCDAHMKTGGTSVFIGNGGWCAGPNPPFGPIDGRP